MQSKDVRSISSQPTTDTILEHIQNNSPDNLVIRVESARYLVPVSAIKLLAWNSVPPFIKDADSEEAKKNQTLRTGLKALIRPFLPEIIKKSWGSEVKIVPRMNILNWLPRYLINILINAVAVMEWEVSVEKCESCEGTVYKVTGISPNTNNIVRATQVPTARADSQSVRGGGEPDAPREEDSHVVGRSVGGRWRASFREIDVGPESTP